MENGESDYEKLAPQADDTGEIDFLFDRMKQIKGHRAEVAQLSAEYAVFLAEKARYEEYKPARKEMINYQAVKNKADRILGLIPSDQEKEIQKEV